MAQLKQVQLAFSPVEDRLLLRINTSAGEQFRFWLTRRFTRLLWPVLMQAAGQDPQVSAQASPGAREAVLSFRHEQAVSGANFTEPFHEDEAPQMPLGESPVLLSRIQLRPGQSGTSVLCLHPEHDQGVEIAMTPELLHSLTRLLAQTVTRAGWDMNLALPANGQASGEQRLN